MKAKHPEATLQIVSILSKHIRYPGTSGSDAARRDIKQILGEIGYKVMEHKAQITNWNIQENPSVEVIEPKRKAFVALPAMLSPPTPAEGVSGRIIEAEPVTMLDAFIWPRIAVVDDEDNPVAFLISSDKDIRVQPLAEQAQINPHVIIGFDSFSELSSTIAAKQEIRLHVKNPSVLDGKCQLVNLLTQEPTDSRYVLICAHYDSTFNSFGALDNASGVAVALELARIAKKQAWPCRFAFFDGEELNKGGSRAFVDSIPDKELSRISHVLEIDTVGAGKEIVFLCSKKLSKPLRNIKLLDGISSEFEVNISPQSRIAFCDVWPFMTRGIPVIRMLTRSLKGSGQGHDLIHTEQDTFDKVDSMTLQASLYSATTLVKRLCEILEIAK